MPQTADMDAQLEEYRVEPATKSGQFQKIAPRLPCCVRPSTADYELASLIKASVSAFTKAASSPAMNRLSIFNMITPSARA
jgi:hypothetical protein